MSGSIPLRMPWNLLRCGGVRCEMSQEVGGWGPHLGVPDVRVDSVADAVEFAEVRVDGVLAGDLHGVGGRHGGGLVALRHRVRHKGLAVVEVVDREHNPRVVQP
eukprot:558380-Prorocentrum_minimum.AAC.4